MHFHHVILLPPEAIDWHAEEIERHCTELMLPFDGDLEVAPYKVWLDHEEVTRMAQYYKLESSDVRALIAHMEQWNGNSGGVDAQGLYYETTRNPRGKWDWWGIGGRWDGWLRAPQTGARNMCRVRDLPPDVTCWSVLLPDGTWHEEGWAYDRCASFEAYGALCDAERLALEVQVEQEWRTRCAELLSAYPDHVAISCDIHR